MKFIEKEVLLTFVISSELELVISSCILYASVAEKAKWAEKWINDEFNALNENDQSIVSSFLSKTGCEKLILKD